MLREKVEQSFLEKHGKTLLLWSVFPIMSMRKEKKENQKGNSRVGVSQCPSFPCPISRTKEEGSLRLCICSYTDVFPVSEFIYITYESTLTHPHKEQGLNSSLALLLLSVRGQSTV